MRKLLIASNNKHKREELSCLFSSYGISVVCPEEEGIFLEVEETGSTFEENAYLKASSFSELSGLPAIADDSGLMVDVLCGAPGVHSARYGGEGLSDAERCSLLLFNLRGQASRRCRFVSAICCVLLDGSVLRARGECEGTVSYVPMGEGGFGYDPIFFLPELKKTFAQLGQAEKNRISHRGIALRNFYKEWGAYHGNLK